MISDQQREKQRFIRAAIEAYQQGEIVSAAFVDRHGVDALVEMAEYRERDERERKSKREGWIGFAITTAIVASILFIMAPHVNAEEPRHESLYNFGNSTVNFFGGVKDGAVDLGKGAKAAWDDDDCPGDIEEMSEECLEGLVELGEAEIKDLSIIVNDAKLELAGRDPD